MSIIQKLAHKAPRSRLMRQATNLAVGAGSFVGRIAVGVAIPLGAGLAIERFLVWTPMLLGR